MCGPKLTKKIDEFIFQMSVEAGLEEPTEANSAIQNFGNVRNPLLETGNTSLFRLERQKNEDMKGINQRVMEKYVDEFRGQQAFY